MARHQVSVLKGCGDVKLTWDDESPEEREKARQTIREMQAQGYDFFIVEPDGQAVEPADAVTAGKGTLAFRKSESAVGALQAGDVLVYRRPQRTQPPVVRQVSAEELLDATGMKVREPEIPEAPVEAEPEERELGDAAAAAEAPVKRGPGRPRKDGTPAGTGPSGATGVQAVATRRVGGG